MMTASQQSNSDDRAKWRGVDLDVRSQAMKDLYIPHADLLEAETVIKHKIFEIEGRHRLNDDDFVYLETVQYGAGILLLGESGAGKSTFAGRLLAQHPSQRTDTATYLPAVYMNVPSGPTERSMGVELLQAMGHPDLSGNAQELRKRCTLLMRKCRVRMLFIDNFQDIPASRKLGIKTLGNWLRNIINGAGCLVIAMGTESAKIVRDSNPELERRMKATARLLPFSVEGITSPSRQDVAKTFSRWYALMSQIDAALPMAESSNLGDPEIAVPLLMGSNARFGYLSEILQHSVKLAVKAGSERIELAHLSEGFVHALGDAAANGNPFLEGYDGEPLTKPGQAFDRLKAA